jgi:hypothetical protein
MEQPMELSMALQMALSMGSPTVCSVSRQAQCSVP